tara:strand:- start:184 stop:411 length:228 start_codon:yes stop_codon:yes gene_type:complete
VNKHIELVKRYLAGEDVTTEELKANSIAAHAAAEAAAEAATHAAHAEAAAHAAAAYAAADYCVKRYEELTSDKLD